MIRSIAIMSSEAYFETIPNSAMRTTSKGASSADAASTAGRRPSMDAPWSANRMSSFDLK